MSPRTLESVARWTARVGSLASLLLLSAFIFGPNEAGKWPTVPEWVGLACFPGGVIVGMLIGWWKERLGGVLTVVSLLGFYAWRFAQAGTFAAGPWFLIFAAPGLLFLLASLLAQPRHAETGRFRTAGS